MVPVLISSPRVLGKRPCFLINQTFLLWRSCRVLRVTWNDLFEWYLALVEC
jgi:hypothetical protein